MLQLHRYLFHFRAIVWLQNRREATVERTRTTSSVRRDDPGEFRVGRLKHERVKVPRGESLMEWAENVMQIHADRKSVLEVPHIKFVCAGLRENQPVCIFPS